MIINGTNLSMVRGDSETIKVVCCPAFADGDIVAVQVRETPDATTTKLSKVVTEFSEGAAFIDIAPEDTASLAPGYYCYDIEVQWANGLKKTIIEKSAFAIREDVTRLAP